MARRNLRVVLVIMALLVAITACSDNSELEEAQAAVAQLESANAALESTVADLESSVVDLEQSAQSLASENASLSGEKVALEGTIAETGQTLILQADIVGDGCMLQNAYINDGESKATFRVRVFDPVTGEQLDDEGLESVTLTLGDGQVFDLSWGPHPPNTEDDFFWTYGWEIFAGYPAGNVSYTITATAADGRTGTFEPFRVAPSLLTVMDATA